MWTVRKISMFVWMERSRQAININVIITERYERVLILTSPLSPNILGPIKYFDTNTSTKNTTFDMSRHIVVTYTYNV